jgi:hypothetical protein
MDFYAQNEAEINKLAEEAKARAPSVPDEAEEEEEEPAE